VFRKEKNIFSYKKLINKSLIKKLINSLIKFINNLTNLLVYNLTISSSLYLIDIIKKLYQFQNL